MAAPNLLSPNGVTPAVESLLSLDQRKQLLSEMLDKKVEQGCRVESQADTSATVVTKGHRGRWFGIGAGGSDTRPRSSIEIVWAHHDPACVTPSRTTDSWTRLNETAHRIIARDETASASEVDHAVVQAGLGAVRRCLRRLAASQG